MTILEPHPFVCAPRGVAGLAFKNAFFTVVTLTLYRFWARTTIRRRIWSRTSVLGDPFEYTGTGWELFRGFLISLPTFFLPAIFVLYIAPLAFDPGAAALMVLAFYAFAIPLINAARFWMRRYQLSRTRWRGIRFALVGSGWGYAWASVGWSLLEGVTLGWYAPVARMKRARLLWDNARYGDQPFSFAAHEDDLADGLYGPFTLGWIGGPLFGIVLGAVLAASIGFALVGSGVNPQASPSDLRFALIPIVALLGFGIAYFLSWMPYNAAAMRRTAELIELDGARFELKITTLGLTWAIIKAALVFVFSIGLLAPLAATIYVRYVFSKLEMFGQPRFADIGQSVVAEPGAGEGIADAFDLDFGVGLV